ncbi:methyltransferase domain-containing protein [Cohnella sp. GCM10027633]|uniref:methyltransferase domain-containing protein n=1 Tax=unclassified Cohnella TaxID=2636738 RepID=UPI003642B694
MDDPTQGGAELEQALRHLRMLNRLLGASRPALYGVKRLWETNGRPLRLTVLDVGSGSGDINRTLLRWARRQGVDLSVMLCDVTEEARIESDRLFRGDSRVSFVKRSVFDLPSRHADIVTASQFAHHYAPDEIPSLIERMLDVSRIGVVINDIHRHWLPWTAVWLLTRLISRNRFIRHDGPLSVAKGFRGDDFREAARRLRIDDMTLSWRPLFRYAAIIPSRREGTPDAQGS